MSFLNSNARPRRRKTLRWIGVLVLSIGTAISSTTGQELSTRTSLQHEFQRELGTYFASQAEHERAEMNQALSWALNRDPTKVYAFIPSDPSLDGSKFPPELQAILDRHAERLFGWAKQAAASGHEGDAYLALFEVLAISPDHEATQVIMGPTVAELFTTANQDPKVTVMRKAERTFGWAPRQWARVDSAHYTILSNADVDELKPIIAKLERLYAVWDQAFYDYWSNSDRLAEALAEGKPLNRGRDRKHTIVAFASRQDYVDRLAGTAPNIEQSKGYYALQRRQSLFFLGDPSAEKSWLHEGSHQLFQERFAARQNVGDRANFWLVEGIAMLMESLDDRGNHATLGGMFCERMQYARFNLFSRQFFRPVEELCQLGQSDFQNDTQVRQLYSQSAGVAQWLMTYDEGKHREGLMQLLKEVYQSHAQPESLLELTGQTADQANREYIDFVRPRKSVLSAFPPSGSLEGLCLAYGDIDNESLTKLDHIKSIDWLDLSEAPISDQGLAAIQELQTLKQLFLAGTAISNEGLVSLQRLTKLEELDLSGTRVTSEGLGRLVELPSLTALSIANTNVDDSAIQHLIKMPSLRSLDASGSKISEQAKDRLRASIPQVK